MASTRPISASIGAFSLDEFPTNLQRKEKLGSGGQAQVELWQNIFTKDLIAVKILKKPAAHGYPSEFRILQQLGPHESIIRCYAFYSHQPEPETDCILFDACSNKDLWDLWFDQRKVNKAVFSEGFIWSLYLQLASALAFLHEGVGATDSRETWQTVVHCDIKMENVFIKALGDEPDMSRIKIKLGDFGMARIYNPRDNLMPLHWGTPQYWPPETTYQAPIAAPSTDVWAIGAIIHKIANSFTPIQDPLEYEAKARQQTPNNKFWTNKNISREKRKFIFEAYVPRQVWPINMDVSQQDIFSARRIRWTPKYSDELNRCMMLALEWDMEKRASAGDLMEQVEEGLGAYYFAELEEEHSSFLDEHGDGRNDSEDGAEIMSYV